MKKILLVILAFLISFCSSENEIQKKIQFELQNISPESAIIKVEVISLEENSNSLKLSTKVEEIIGYGSSTTPINSGTILEFIVDKNEFSKKYPKVKSKIFIEVQSSGEEMLGSTNIKWMLKKIIN